MQSYAGNFENMPERKMLAKPLYTRFCRVIPSYAQCNKNTFYLPRQEANTSLEMLIFTGENADCDMNLQRFYRESNNR